LVKFVRLFGIDSIA